MKVTKEKTRYIHEPSTYEIFQSLSGMPAYSKILIEQNPDQPYSDFLRWLISKNFYNERTEKIAIKKIASDFNTETTKVTKWLKKIYEQIFELNFNKPELFQKNGIKVDMYISHYDSSCSFYLSLPILPREFETFRFPFVKGKVGTDYFWVKKVEHEIVEDIASVTLWLVAGFVNKYREFALDKALFQDRIPLMDVYHKHDFELDDELKKIFRS
ncbi:MAG: hypothetical protein H7Y00_16095 [Fimbriimonadaceae bacterium]|nr:hypothetical protein [Chitinophagales bacterium]